MTGMSSTWVKPSPPRSRPAPRPGPGTSDRDAMTRRDSDPHRGWASRSRASRRSSHAWSPHSWRLAVMMLAVEGGCSHWRAIGSAFRRPGRRPLDGVLVAGADLGVGHPGSPHAGGSPGCLRRRRCASGSSRRRPRRRGRSAPTRRAGGTVVLDVRAERQRLPGLADQVEVDITQQGAGGGGRHAADSPRPDGVRPVRATLIRRAWRW